MRPPVPLPVVSLVSTALSEPSTGSSGVPTGDTRCSSVRSTSLKSITPLSLRLPLGVTASVTAPIRSCAITTGASLVPVIVMSIWRVRTEPFWSFSVIVKLSTRVCPAARYSTALAATL